MLVRIKKLALYLASLSSRTARKVATPLAQSGPTLKGMVRPAIVLAAVGGVGYLLVTHPPVETVQRGEVGVRINQLSGSATEVGEGTILVLPGLHHLQRYSLRDQIYRPHNAGSAPFQSVEGMSIGVDLSIRYALDPQRITSTARNLPSDIGTEVVQPQVEGVIYKTFTRYTVREIFSTKRAEIQQSIEQELKPKLAADGIILRSVMMGKVELPADYRAGLEGLLAEELSSEKMRYTLELKEKQVKQSELESEAESVRQQKAAETAAAEQIIAAKAQEESMKHVLPFKEKQIQQRQLEAEADKVSRIKMAEAAAEAHKIEAAGEAVSRQKLAEADAYRVEVMGKAQSAQMARDGELISKHPLLIQKTLADKLSDKISVIIAPPPSDGGFIGATLLGGNKAAANAQQTNAQPGNQDQEGAE